MTDPRVKVLEDFFMEEKFGIDLSWMSTDPLYRAVLASHREVYAKRARVLLSRLDEVSAK